ncbi:MAG: hypothetical protein ACKVHE_03410 [Planctomycetales bacterium]|jgi:hypothetical protein
MDCQTALEHLDCVRPDSNDLDLPEMADARAHLDSCDSCQQSFAEMQSLDRAVTNVVLNVDVPEGLRVSLVETSVNEAAANSRRRRLQAAASVACALMLGVAAWLWQPQVQFAEAELLQRLPIDLSATEQFDTSFELALPAPWTGNPRLRVGREFRGIDLDDKAGHDAAVVIFSYSPSRNAPINGILAAIPASRVSPLSESVSFAQADSRYIQKDGRRPVAAVWREGDTVYVCLVLGSAADLERIQRNLSTAAA